MNAYLNYASAGPLRPRAREAMRQALDEILPYGSARAGPLMAAIGQARTAAAGLLDCAPRDVGLLPNTSVGVHLVADGLAWHAGDEVILFDGDFPANVRPWTRLTDRGVRVRWVPMRDGGYDLAELAASLTPATRLIAVSQVHFATGHRVDVDAVCALAAQVDALVFVDAIQGLGVVPFSVRRTPVDFLAAGAYKWLCSPAGTGLFYCRPDRLDLLLGGASGWRGYAGAADLFGRPEPGLSYELPPKPGVRRFEGGTPNLLGLLGLARALEELSEIGASAVFQRVQTLAERLRAALLNRGYEVLGWCDADRRSGIVGFRHPRRPADVVYRALTEGGCHLSLLNGNLRVSPHYWTADDEVTAFVDVLSTLRLQAG